MYSCGSNHSHFERSWMLKVIPPVWFSVDGAAWSSCWASPGLCRWVWWSLSLCWSIRQKTSAFGNQVLRCLSCMLPRIPVQHVSKNCFPSDFQQNSQPYVHIMLWDRGQFRKSCFKKNEGWLGAQTTGELVTPTGSVARAALEALDDGRPTLVGKLLVGRSILFQSLHHCWLVHTVITWSQMVTYQNTWSFVAALVMILQCWWVRMQWAEERLSKMGNMNEAWQGTRRQN